MTSVDPKLLSGVERIVALVHPEAEILFGSRAGGDGDDASDWDLFVVPQGIRVNAISPGPLKTRAASGLKDFELLFNEAAERAPFGELIDTMDVVFVRAYLATSLQRVSQRWLDGFACTRRNGPGRMTSSPWPPVRPPALSLDQEFLGPEGKQPNHFRTRLMLPRHGRRRPAIHVFAPAQTKT